MYFIIAVAAWYVMSNILEETNEWSTNAGFNTGFIRAKQLPKHEFGTFIVSLDTTDMNQSTRLVSAICMFQFFIRIIVLLLLIDTLALLFYDFLSCI